MIARTLGDIKTKISATASSVLSVLGISGGGASAVCQTTCSTSSAVLPLIGVSLSATPFAFLEEYQLQIWWVAVIFLGLLLFLYFKGISKTRTDRALLFVNAGLLTAGFPYVRELSLMKFLPWIAGAVLVVGLYLFLTARTFQIRFKDS